MRLVWEGIRIAFAALRGNKLRTFLTLLGNIVGIMSVIAVASLLRGIDKYAREKVAEEGSNVFTIERVDVLGSITDWDKLLEALRNNPPIRRDDVAVLRQRLSKAEYVSASVSTRARVGVFDKYISNISVKGQDEYYPFIDNVEIHSGRHLNRLDVDTNSPVAVIGWELYTRLFEPKNPVDRLIRIGRRHFKVIGVAEDRGTVLGMNQNRFVIVPIGSYQKLFGSEESIEVRVKAADVSELPGAIEEARFVMRTLHRLKPRENDDFDISTSEQLVSLWRQISGGIMMALFALVSISLVVGGVVLMNTMLVAVTERTREVGVRKALGARRLDIIWQFLVESATLSFVGGLLGMLIGMFIAVVVSLATPIPYTFDAAIVALAFVVTIVIGLVFGTYPAVKAAMLNPVDALRYE